MDHWASRPLKIEDCRQEGKDHQQGRSSKHKQQKQNEHRRREQERKKERKKDRKTERKKERKKDTRRHSFFKHMLGGGRGVYVMKFYS